MSLEIISLSAMGTRNHELALFTHTVSIISVGVWLVSKLPSNQTPTEIIATVYYILRPVTYNKTDKISSMHL